MALWLLAASYDLLLHHNSRTEGGEGARPPSSHPPPQEGGGRGGVGSVRCTRRYPILTACTGMNKSGTNRTSRSLRFYRLVDTQASTLIPPPC